MLTSLLGRDFRCFEEFRLEPAPGLNFLVGRNAQGKTSLLEAACVLLRLQSPRTTSLGETVRFGQPGFGLDGHWRGRHLQLKFTSSLKSFALDSKPQSRSADYLSVGRVIWISNDDLQLVRGSGTPRRRYLDFLGAQVEPGYLRSLRAYERALRSRNALLKEGRPSAEVAAFDEPLLRAGQMLLTARSALARALAPLTADAYQQISGNSETLVVSYRPGCPGEFADALRQSRAEESHRRITVVGPHRDDLLLSLDGQDAAAFASEGQQRSLALALKLAQARHLEASAESPPLYLIDDVFGELDPFRRQNLLAALPDAAQKLITTTHLEWLASDVPATIWNVGEGQIKIAE